MRNVTSRQLTWDLISTRVLALINGVKSDLRSVLFARFQPVTTCLPPACQRTMWRGKMAARWRGKDGEVNAGNNDFMASNTPNEVPVSSL